MSFCGSIHEQSIRAMVERRVMRCIEDKTAESCGRLIHLVEMMPVL
jgi:hypothetical protein